MFGTEPKLAFAVVTHLLRSMCHLQPWRKELMRPLRGARLVFRTGMPIVLDAPSLAFAGCQASEHYLKLRRG